jgi:membrane associated rhomboid family serine protease
MDLTINLIIIIVTCLVSIGGFNNQKIIDDLIFHPASMKGGKQLHRYITHGFIHADAFHLIFNMFTLYFFGNLIEVGFTTWSGSKLTFLVFYLSALIVASIPDYAKHKDQYNYRSLGASGAVNAILFSFILIAPWQQIMVWFIPMPAIVFAVLYTIYSIYMDKRGGDNINHSAHLWGAAYGLAFTLVLKPDLFSSFLEKIMNPSF